MDPKTLELLINRIPEFIFSVANIGFLIQLRKMSVNGEKIKVSEQKIVDLQAESESLRYQYQQLLVEYNRIEGENKTYKQFHDHPVVT